MYILYYLYLYAILLLTCFRTTHSIHTPPPRELKRNLLISITEDIPSRNNERDNLIYLYISHSIMAGSWSYFALALTLVSYVSCFLTDGPCHFDTTAVGSAFSGWVNMKFIKIFHQMLFIYHCFTWVFYNVVNIKILLLGVNTRIF